jgi:hypothetical protein
MEANMKKILSLIAATGLLAVGACSTAASDDPAAESDSVDQALTAPVVTVNAWNGGYTANVTLTNPLATQTSHWTVVIDMNGSTLSGSWNVAFTGTSGKITGRPMSYNTNIAPNGTVSFGFNGNSPNNTKPIVVAWNMDTGNYAVCDSNSGTMPTMAAMAVAAGKELGRWNIEKDLTVTNNQVAVASTAVCTNGCKNLKALLAQQSDTVQQFYDQQSFNVANFRSTVMASLDRQKNQTINTAGLAALMANHKLKLVQGPVDLKVAGSCGPHYVFQVDYKSTGLPLSSADASKLANSLCFFNAAGCGGNKYIGYISSGLSGCPSGKTCIAIDPLDGDNASTNTTSAGSAPTYPQNRVLADGAVSVGAACLTVKGQQGTLMDKCSLVAATCGYYYCVAS